MLLPFWSVRRNGPPIAAAGLASVAGPRPVTSSTTAKHSTSPARKADRMSSRRVVRGFMLSILSAHSRPRLRGDRLQQESRAKNWVPAFAGTSGVGDRFTLMSARLKTSRDAGRDDLE